jgi:hypothetical protein
MSWSPSTLTMERIDAISICISMMAVVLVVSYPEETYFYTEKAILMTKLFVVNAYCWAVALTIYLRLLWSFRRLGMPAPPFRFVPIWNRQ